MSPTSDRNESLAVLALAAQSLLAFAGGIVMASAMLPGDSEWAAAGGVGLFAAVWAGYGAAHVFGVLLAPLFLAQAAARYASHGEVPGTRGPTRADRAFERIAAVLAVAVTLLVSALTGLVLWAVAGTDFLNLVTGFLALGAGLSAITPLGLRALG